MQDLDGVNIFGEQKGLALTIPSFSPLPFFHPFHERLGISSHLYYSAEQVCGNRAKVSMTKELQARKNYHVRQRPG